tara:strand:+ start:160 stop:501 length:342 start_codon:yes stop_codon:yes gene_type:complete
MKIYHNPRCRKSRQTLTIIKNKTSEFEIIEYIKNKITFDEITKLLVKLNMKPLEIVRTQESIWKENYKTENMSDNEIINALAKYPKLIERPIVESNNKAIIGRPPENVLSLFD